MRRWTALHVLVAIMLLAMSLPASAGFQRCYVKPGALGTGTSWSNAMPFTNALGSSCDEIWVAQGIYRPAPPGGPNEASFIIGAGQEVYGSFVGLPGTEGDFTQRDPVRYMSVLTGDLAGNDIVDAQGISVVANVPSAWMTDNVSHVVFFDGNAAPINADTRFDGFTITGGSAMGAPITYNGHGSGLMCLSDTAAGRCNPTLSNLRFSGNEAFIGGALYVLEVNGMARPTIAHVSFDRNSSLQWQSPFGPLIADLSAFGGETPLRVSNITVSSGPSQIFTPNVLIRDGKAEFINSSLLSVMNLSSDVTIRNSIVDGSLLGTESSYQISDSVVAGGCVSSVNMSCTNVSTADPLLGPMRYNGGTTQTRLPLSGSPAIDMGNASICSSAPVNGVDQRGVARPQGPACDIGAAEVRHGTLSVAVSGAGRVDATAPAAQYGAINNCTSTQTANCVATFPGEPALVTLTATPSTPAHVVTWGGACSGSANVATVAVNAAPTACTASFSVPTVWTVQTSAEAPSVTSNACTVVAPGPGGTCTTLRDAMNRALNGDTIRFVPALDGSTITLTLFTNDLGCESIGPGQCSGAGTPTVQFGPSAFFINGKALTVDAVSGMQQGITLARGTSAEAFRLFDVSRTGGLALRGLTLRNGLARGGNSNFGGGALGAGGAVFNRGTLTVERSTFTGNLARGGEVGVGPSVAADSGGGVGQNAPLTLTAGGPNGGALNANGGFGGGGGFALAGLRAVNGGVGGFGGGGGVGFGTAPNTPDGFGGAGGFGAGGGGGYGGNGLPGFGGGRSNFNSTSSCCGGAGAGLGGAIFNDAGTVRIGNTTFTANVAQGGGVTSGDEGGSGYGGALFNYAGSMELVFTTLQVNTVTASTNDLSAARADGGAVYSLGDSAAGCAAGGNLCTNGNAGFIAKNSVFAGSIARHAVTNATGDANDIVIVHRNAGVSTGIGTGNLLRRHSGYTGEIVSDAAPLLDAIVVGGGLVSVMIPAAGSPLLDAAASCAEANGIDQRGMPRPQGDACDIGAAERFVDLDTIFRDGFDVP